MSSIHTDMRFIDNVRWNPRYLRDLPEPLFMYGKWEEWTTALYIENNDEKLYELQRLVDSLPEGHRATLKFLTRFFANVAKYGDINLMKESNLSLVIGPNLLRKEDRSFGT